MAAKMSTVGWIAVVLVLVGALNWGLVGALGFNLVSYLVGLLGDISWLENAIYILVGLAGLWGIYELIIRRFI